MNMKSILETDLGRGLLAGAIVVPLIATAFTLMAGVLNFAMHHTI